MANQGPPEPDFTLDQFLREVSGEEDIDEGLTRRELESATGMGKTWILGQLRELKDQGKLTVIKKRIESLDGRMLQVPAYKIRYNEDNDREENDEKDMGDQ